MGRGMILTNVQFANLIRWPDGTTAERSDECLQNWVGFNARFELAPRLVSERRKKGDKERKRGRGERKREENKRK